MPQPSPQQIRAALTERLRADEVLSPVVPEVLAAGAWWDGRDVAWPAGLEAGLIEPRDGYRFRPESVAVAALLAGRRAARIVDLGAGSGALLLIATYVLNPERAVGLEVQPTQVDRLRRSFAAHGLAQVAALEGDLRDPARLQEVSEQLGGPADLVLANPPYYPSGWGRPSAEQSTHWSTHAEHGDAGDFLRAAAALLAERASVLAVYDATRLAELLVAAGRAGLGIEQLVWIPDQRPGRGGEATRCWVELSRSGAPVRPL